MTTKIVKLKQLIRYLSIVKELQKLDKEGAYDDVSIIFPADLVITERWEKKISSGNTKRFYSIEFPISDIDEQTKRARDRLRYAKQKVGPRN